MDDCDIDLGLLALKKKKKKKITSELQKVEEGDYTYAMLVSRVFASLRQNNTALLDRPEKVHLIAPDVMREGRKTVVANFVAMCEQIGRPREHVMAFILKELRVPGSLDGTHRLVLRGRFVAGGIEKVLRAYITAYVMCKECKSLDTMMFKGNLSCNLCHSSVFIGK